MMSQYPRKLTLHGRDQHPYLHEGRLLSNPWKPFKKVPGVYQELLHLRYAIHHDSLTKLPNRRYWDAAAESFLSDGASVFVMDLDGFKQVNDTLGHDAGDALLAATAVHLASLAQSCKGFVARLGGDEFAGVIPSGHDTEVNNLSRICNGTIGIHRYALGESLREAMMDADSVMYATKRKRFG
jgi:predicted signal transduction protein with EAL and GGDEF domain